MNNPSAPSQKSKGRNAYWASGIILCAVLAASGIAFVLPHKAGAFWPFALAQADSQSNLPFPDSTRSDVFDVMATDTASTSPLTPDGSSLVGSGAVDLTQYAPVSQDQTDFSSTAISEYTVQDGDTLSGIAKKFNISTNTILWANDLTIHSTIHPGMKLVILPVSGIQHKVKAGETLSSIAAAYHADANEIATFNGLDSNATVVSGSTLIIPGADTAPVSSSSSSKSSSSKSTSKSSSSSVKVRSDLGAPAATTGYFRNPVPGAILTQGIHGKNGVDLGAPAGTPIHAAAAGTVILSKGDGAWNGGYGSYVVISHSNGTQTLYAHMSKDVASVGETVAAGTVIGYVGETGEATGNHLHFEVRGARNPFGYSCTVDEACY